MTHTRINIPQAPNRQYNYFWFYNNRLYNYFCFYSKFHTCVSVFVNAWIYN